MKSILVAVDGSPHSLKAIAQAAELAKGLEARLELVFVLPPILLAPSVYGEAVKKVEEGNRLAAEEILGKAKKAAAEAGVDADTVMASGAPAEAIADLAKDERIWGVVIGAKGQDRKSTRLNSSHNPASRMPSSA
jgi:nucleotide-binding universal stress UspA family protein